jgi:hypothetical protein
MKHREIMKRRGITRRRHRNVLKPRATTKHPGALVAIAERAAHRVIKRPGILRLRAITKGPGTLAVVAEAERVAHRVTVVVAEAADTAGAVEAKAVTAEVATAEDTAKSDYKVFFPRPEVAPPGEFGPSFYWVLGSVK